MLFEGNVQNSNDSFYNENRTHKTNSILYVFTPVPCRWRTITSAGRGGLQTPHLLGFFANSEKNGGTKRRLFCIPISYILSAPFGEISAQGHLRSGQVTQPPKIFVIAMRLQFLRDQHETFSCLGYRYLLNVYLGILIQWPKVRSIIWPNHYI